jgi:integrase
MKRRKLIRENPFDGVNAPATGIKDRQRFVTREETVRMLDACPNHHWRTIIGLCRFGGLRNPSETLSLRWQDIDWEAGRIVVTSPKTEHHTARRAARFRYSPNCGRSWRKPATWPPKALFTWSMRSTVKRQWVRPVG